MLDPTGAISTALTAAANTATSRSSYETTVPILSGCFTFGTTLALSTLAQKVAGISTATKIVPSVFGMATVCFASLACQQMAIHTHSWIQNPKRLKEMLLQPRNAETKWVASSSSSSPAYQDCYDFGGYVKIPKHSVRVCIVGLLTFKLLGGRFWAIAPSSITNVGSFARWSKPCSPKYADTSERVLVEKYGKRWGCHTCGSRMLFASSKSPTRSTHKFVADHMPPKSVAEQMNRTWWRRVGLWRKVRYRFYPQCVNCSNLQGSLLGKAKNKYVANQKGSYLPAFVQASLMQNAGAGQNAHFHGLRPRINHITGGVIAGVTVVDATKNQIAKGNPRRFEYLQRIAEDVAKSIGLTTSTATKR